MRPGATWVALVHHPVYDKHRRVVATALTNLDLHDIARACRTYGLAGFLVVHPVEAQRTLAERILGHWRDGGAELNDFRRQAIERVAVVPDLDAAVAHVTRASGAAPRLLATSAQKSPEAIEFSAAHQALGDGPAVLVLGTGWGLTEAVLARCHARLAPIQVASDYNHLSVRSACAIVLDRLFGDR